MRFLDWFKKSDKIKFEDSLRKVKAELELIKKKIDKMFDETRIKRPGMYMENNVHPISYVDPAKLLPSVNNMVAEIQALKETVKDEKILSKCKEIIVLLQSLEAPLKKGAKFCESFDWHREGDGRNLKRKEMGAEYNSVFAIMEQIYNFKV